MPSLGLITPQTIITDVNTFAGFLTSTKRVDVVKILDQTTVQQVFQAARPLDAEVIEASRGLKYPIETGATLTDSIIIEPTIIRMVLNIPSSAYSTVYPQIRTGRLSGTLYTVQTRTGTYKNMFIEEMPHKETTDRMNAIIMQLKFVEALQVSTSSNGSTTILDNYSPASPTDQSTVNQGLLSGVAAASSVLSYFHAASVVGL